MSPPVELAVVTWNLNAFTEGQREAKRELLEAIEWDVACLQEVKRSSFGCIAERFQGCTGLDLHDAGGGAWGAAIFVRDGVGLRDAELVPVGASQPEAGVWASPERALAARVEVRGARLTAVSWHAPHAAGDGQREKKMRAYRSVQAWLGGRPGLTLVGADLNSWTDPLDLHQPDPSDPHYEEHRFVLADPEHGLVDAWRSYLGANPDRGRRWARIRPDGPLAVTYNRGSKTRPEVCRMDRIFLSPEIDVLEVEHLYAEALAVGSDHALVRARIKVGG